VGGAAAGVASIWLRTTRACILPAEDEDDLGERGTETSACEGGVTGASEDNDDDVDPLGELAADVD